MEAMETPLANSRKILVLLDNLFFAAKINQAAAQNGVNLIYAKTSDQAIELAHLEKPDQIILDLDATKCSPLEFLARLKTGADLQTVPTIGFVSHVNLDLQQQAREAGCDRILARSTFDKNLSTILSQIS
ncbi:MAG TPA: response regulator [Blastocatellia bacterium]|nr:response regulator [Blastocatellia bacterium]HMV83990.1 response regulator [Blastocatellia bacterium]HMX24862.1 response regulator [Blastocatellia bacterium]HMY73669.1 response regulator [Blastocatellia bacterium]HMZ19471.1 response regulator [Blastocatellia bacterium]